MKDYYLMYSEQERRFVIDSVMDPDMKLEKTVSAKSWVDAKDQFGFKLTRIQESMI